MFLLFHLFTSFPLVACSIAAGCCQSRVAIVLWTVGAMLMPTLLCVVLACMSFIRGDWELAGWAVLVGLTCYGVSFLLRFVTRHVKRVLSEPCRHLKRVLTQPYREGE